MPKVYNKRTDNNIPPDAVYVGRPSKWGNPFKMRYDTLEERLDVIFSYKTWLEEQVWDGKLNMSELKGRDLVCWCAPLPCHADILLELANK